jgi:DNA-binding transcriptional LysR family regulator
MPSLRRMLPSTSALFVFEAAARCGSFTRAATELNVTQPAVSRMLARLEAHLGVRLFERSPAGLALTEEGKMLYRRISQGFEGIADAIREIEARRSGTETVTLSVSTAFTTHWLMPRLDKLQKEFPSVDLRFQLIAGPIHGPVEDVDLGMRFVEDETGAGPASFVMREIMVPVCSPSYADRHRRKNAADGHTIINLTDAEPSWPGQFDELSAGRAGQLALVNLSDYAIVVQAALLGQGVALGWLNVVSHWLIAGDLVPAARRIMRTSRMCHLLHSRARPMRPVVAEIRHWLTAEMRSDIAALDRLYPGLGVPDASLAAQPAGASS